jgi:hypothetical protein
MAGWELVKAAQLADLMGETSMLVLIEDEIDRRLTAALADQVTV